MKNESTNSKNKKEIWIGLIAFALMVMFVFGLYLNYCSSSSSKPVGKYESVTVGNFKVSVSSFEIDDAEYYAGAGYKLATVTLRVTNISSFSDSFTNSVDYGVDIRYDNKNISSSSSQNGSNIQPEQIQSVKFFFHIPNNIASSNKELLLRVKEIDGRKINEKFILLR